MIFQYFITLALTSPRERRFARLSFSGLFEILYTNPSSTFEGWLRNSLNCSCHILKIAAGLWINSFLSLEHNSITGKEDGPYTSLNRFYNHFVLLESDAACISSELFLNNWYLISCSLLLQVSLCSFHLHNKSIPFFLG